MQHTSPEELLAHGVHFGHKSQKVHPRARKYIYKIEKGISIIDLFKTADELKKAKEFIFTLGRENKQLLVVATKKQVKNQIAELCQANEILHMTNKWIGGFLTNFEEIDKNIKKMITMYQDQEGEAWKAYPKHERFKLEKKLKRIEHIYAGVKNIAKRPDALFVVDIRKERNAVEEANRQNIPVVAIVDTNCDPMTVPYPIPANDDAITSVMYITQQIIDAYVEGRKSIETTEKK